MSKLILYIAASIDAKIATSDGSVGWLEQTPNPENTDYGYMEFFKTVGTTIMGNKTYLQILSFDIPFPYQGKKNYVLTRNKRLTKDENVTYYSGDIHELVSGVKEKEDKNIWLIGGAELNSLFLKERLIDELWLFQIPVILGEGIPLFYPVDTKVVTDCIEQTDYSNGVVGSKYRLRYS